MKKRAQLVFQVLIGLVLSAIVLFMIYSFFMKGFFNSYSNYDLAKLEGKDIANFLDIAKDSKFSDCYYLFNVGNSPNIQFSDSEKYLYFLYLTGKGIFLFKAPISEYNDNFIEKTLEEFESGKDLSVKYFRVPGGLNICEDETSSGSFIVQSLTVVLGRPDKEISLNDLYSGGIVIKPVLSKVGGDTYYKVSIFQDGELSDGAWTSVKDSLASLFGGGDEVNFVLDSSTNYIVYSKKDDCVFVPNGIYSKLLAMANMCHFKEIAEAIKEKQLDKVKSKFLSGGAGGSIFYNQFVVECDKSKEKFVWDVSQPNMWVCDGCRGEVKSSCSIGVKKCYYSFVKYVKSYFRAKFNDTDIGFKLYVKDAKPVHFLRDETTKLSEEDFLVGLNDSVIKRVSNNIQYFNGDCDLVEDRIIRKRNLFSVEMNGTSLEGIINNGVLYFCSLDFLTVGDCGDTGAGYDYLARADSVNSSSCYGFNTNLLRRDGDSLYVMGRTLETKFVRNNVNDEELVLFKFRGHWYGITKKQFEGLYEK